MKSLASKYGGWAVVTGATAGIGKNFAHQLARDGMHIVLVARSEDALHETSEELRTEYAIQTRVLALDLAHPMAAETVDLETLDLDVGLLINNAAVEQRGAFVRQSAEELRNAIDLNVTTPTELRQRFGRVGIMKLRPGYVAKVGLKLLGRRPSVVVGGQYKFFAMLTKRVLSRAAEAWLFGTLIRIAIGDKRLLDPTFDLDQPARKAKASFDSSAIGIEINNCALACRK